MNKKIINIEHHPTDSRIRVVDDEICQTLNTRMGTGGGNVPLIIEVVEDERTDNTGIKPKPCNNQQ